MKPSKIDGGIFTTDEGLKISIPPKNIIEKEVLRKELLKIQEEYLMEIEAVSNYIYKDEAGNIVKRVAEDGQVLTEGKNGKSSKESGIDR